MCAELREPTPQEVRQVIASIPDSKIVTAPPWSQRIDGFKLRSLDRFLYLSGCRINECITGEKHRRCTGGEAALVETTFNGSEKVGQWTLYTLKRKVGLKEHCPTRES
jgi:hypothetical protein